MVRVEVDRSKCIGTGFCVADAPQTFEFDDEGLAQARVATSSGPEDGLREVAANCPASAIRITD